MNGYPTSYLLDIYVRLRRRYGDPDWWPGDTPFEIAVGAVLTQNTSWSNVEKAVKELGKRDLLNPCNLLSCSDEALSDIIRSTGYHNQKTGYLKNLSSWTIEHADGDIERLSHRDPWEIRALLLDVKGIGEETADSILCYGLGMPVLVIDAYTRRVLSRLSPRYWDALSGKEKIDYNTLQGHLMERLRGDAGLYNRLHALIVLLCKECCLSRPICKECPLIDICAIGIGGSLSEKGK